MSVLMVSATPTHPPDAGNRARIFRLAEELRSLGGDPFFLYYGTEPADLGAMRAFWGERLCVVPAKAGPKPPRGRWNALAARLGKRPSPGPVDVDAWCAPDLEEAALRLHTTHRFRIIWVEYVFLSRVLCRFDGSVLKVIDAHDVFSERYEMIRRGVMDPEWFFTTLEMERKGLARADRVVAIQEKDASSFRAMGLPRVLTIGHFPRVRPAPGGLPRNRILFIASDNSGNVRTWDHFVRTMLGPIGKRLPDASVLVAGKICRRIPDSPRYERLGRVEDLGTLYGSATLAINPEVCGTGLKIKTLEPLAHGCPVVATPAGIRGIEEAEGRGILVGGTPGEFVEALERLMTRPSLRDEQRRAGLDFIGDYLRRNRQGLSDLLEAARPPEPKECSP